MRKFTVRFYDWKCSNEISHAVIALEDEVIDRVDDEWVSRLYNLETPEDIAIHIAHNLFILRIKLSQMDGWADLPDHYVKVIKPPFLPQNYDIRAEESK